jgi:hypothetical protein
MNHFIARDYPIWAENWLKDRKLRITEIEGSDDHPRGTMTNDERTTNKENSAVG